ncbi:hypothetical protein [Nocardia sp. NPDC057440]|uniref:hypothetical protein n=1 Tax=Nocardia sp. NPDC057440 TaxID=3346134 RepID=UPI0036735862
MWAIVGRWIPDRDGGFGVVTTESCDQLTVRDALIEADGPLRTGDRVGSSSPMVRTRMLS